MSRQRDVRSEVRERTYKVRLPPEREEQHAALAGTAALTAKKAMMPSNMLSLKNLEETILLRVYEGHKGRQLQVSTLVRPFTVVKVARH